MTVSSKQSKYGEGGLEFSALPAAGEKQAEVAGSRRGLRVLESDEPDGLQTLEGSFSAVSKPNFASKYSLEEGTPILSKKRTWGKQRRK